MIPTSVSYRYQTFLIYFHIGWRTAVWSCCGYFTRLKDVPIIGNNRFENYATPSGSFSFRFAMYA